MSPSLMRSPASSPYESEPSPVMRAVRPSSSLPSAITLRASPPSAHWSAIQARSSMRRSVTVLRYSARRAQLPLVQFLGSKSVAGRAPRAGAGAVQILTPKQELHGVIAGGDIRLHAAGLLQVVGEQFLGEFRGVERLAADGERDILDDVGDVEFVLGQLVSVSRGDVIDQALVEGPGIHPALPVIDDGVAEAVGLGLHVRNAGGDPGGAGAAQIRLGRLGNEGVDRELECLGGVEGILVSGLRDIRVVLQHVLGRVGRGRCETEAKRQGGGGQSSQRSSKHLHPFFVVRPFAIGSGTSSRFLPANRPKAEECGGPPAGTFGPPQG